MAHKMENEIYAHPVYTAGLVPPCEDPPPLPPPPPHAVELAPQACSGVAHAGSKAQRQLTALHSGLEWQMMMW